ncbi:MAG TPA: TonB-dependent receptor, partial [Methylotenera sp.]|nr:TonB-dependent receptor [Methylotenera sp.]HPN01370.1 TonB-dependent receptor [Methylotenera sp.]
TDLVGNGLLPSEEYARDPTSVFTSPDTTKNRLAQFQFSSAFQVNDNFSITGQVYRRNSKRHQIGADVFTDWDELKGAKLVPPENDGYTCMFKSTQGGDHPNLYGIPDYLVIPVNRTLGENIATVEIFNDWLNNNGVVDLDVKYAPFKNLALPDNFVAGFKDNFNKSKNFYEQFYYNRGSLANPPPTGEIDFDGSGFPQAATAYGMTTFGGPQALVGAFEYYPNENILMTAPDNAYFSEIRPNGDKIQQVVIFLAPVNNATCRADPNATLDFPGPYNTLNPNTGFPYLIDGFAFGEPGYVEGTPTAVITDNQINQLVNGASIQFNWNLEQHKFMVGASIDSANAEYANTQQLGFLNANRKAFLAPDLANPQFSGADTPLANNDFSGNNITKSVYFSETWSPTEQWHFNASGRYNDTHGKNKIAARYGFGAFGIGDAVAVPDEYEVCKTDEECLIPRNYRPLNTINQRVLDPAETEKFSYYSFNPSLGVTWQAKENLNLFANWAKGTRTPSVIELGCAFDKTPTNPVAYTDAFGNFHPQDLTPKSISENRSCSLPTALSGDPYLPQIKSTSYDVGARGSIGENLQWNLGAYQTDLKDDIYFITAGNQQGFFDTIGKTRRRGLEAGISVKQDKLSVGFNYSLTDATFQDNFLMLSADNSSSFALDGYGSGVIQVEKGNRMPGVPLHNLNASISYEMTDKWTVGLSSVVHSESFVRGNENNKHRVGVAQARTFVDPVLGPITVYRQPSTNPGKVPGYATFNFQTSYKFNKEWTASMLINNVFDKEYFSAGRLGRNPFSPSINGAIGPDGYNHNSGDWLSTNFIAPSAPRGIWFSLNWQFAPEKKKVSTDDAATAIEPAEVKQANELERNYQPLPPPLNRYQGLPKVEE